MYALIANFKILYILSICDKYSKLEPRSFKPLRRFFKIYVRGIRGAGELRNQLMSTETTDEVRALLDNFESKNLDVIGQQ